MEIILYTYLTMAVMVAFAILFKVGTDMDGAERIFGNVGLFLYPFLIAIFWIVFVPILLGMAWAKRKKDNVS